MPAVLLRPPLAQAWRPYVAVGETLPLPDLRLAPTHRIPPSASAREVKARGWQRSGNMRLRFSSRSHSFGLLHIAEEAQVVELDTQLTHDHGQGSNEDNTSCVSRRALDNIMSVTVIVVPCRNEELWVIRGVISALPAACLVILVSNCQQPEGGSSQYQEQLKMLQTFARRGRQILAVHQKDTTVAAAFQTSGMSDLLDPEDGTVRDGKGEGMLLGIALAAALCPERRYVGFVDADNFNPGSVNEYCRAFAAGFAMSPPPEKEETMVRLRWSSKPKVREGQIEFAAEGRSSTIVNSWLNRLFRHAAAAAGDVHESHGGDLITTGNAGEHAMTMGLALKLRVASGYAIEPFHFVDLLERGCFLASPSPSAPETEPAGPVNGASGLQGADAVSQVPASPEPEHRPKPLDKPVRILQIRTLNPHFHRASDDDHIRHMWAAGLGSIYHGLAAYDHDYSSAHLPTLRFSPCHHRHCRCFGLDGIRLKDKEDEDEEKEERDEERKVGEDEGGDRKEEGEGEGEEEEEEEEEPKFTDPLSKSLPLRPSAISSLRRAMHAFAGRHGGLRPETGALPRPRVYPPLADLDLRAFREAMLRALQGPESSGSDGEEGGSSTGIGTGTGTGTDTDTDTNTLRALGMDFGAWGSYA